MCLIAALFTLLLCTGCKNKQSNAANASVPQRSAFPITINGTTFESSPQKVISLSPFITDMIFDIGAESKLAGVCEYCEGDMANVGTAISPDINAIVSSGASLVFTQTPLDVQDETELESAGISIMEIKAPVSVETLENLYASMIALLCADADFQFRAQEITACIDNAVADFAKSEKRVLCVVSKQQNIAGTGTLCDDIVNLIAQNACAETGYANVLDSTVASNADIIFADVSLKNVDITEFTGSKTVVYVDFSALENPCAENLGALLNQMCENL